MSKNTKKQIKKDCERFQNAMLKYSNNMQSVSKEIDKVIPTFRKPYEKNMLMYMCNMHDAFGLLAVNQAVLFEKLCAIQIKLETMGEDKCQS